MLTGLRRAAASGCCALLLCAVLAPVPGRAEHKGRRSLPKPPVVLPPPAAAGSPLPPVENKPYDPQLLRLAEILGALTYLRDLCGANDGATWRARMQALLDAEGVPRIRKDRLAGAYNHGIQGYGLSYRTCTPNAHVVIKRFLEEGSRIAKDVENRYRAS